MEEDYVYVCFMCEIDWWYVNCSLLNTLKGQKVARQYVWYDSILGGNICIESKSEDITPVFNGYLWEGIIDILDYAIFELFTTSRKKDESGLGKNA